MVNLNRIKRKFLAPEQKKDEKTESSMKEVIPLMELQQGRFCIVAFMYFFGLVFGMIALLESGLISSIGATMFTLALVIWISGPTTIFLLLIYRTYRPLADIVQWLDKKIDFEEKEQVKT